MMKTAIITGICGQDGAYLAQYLQSLGYKVIGWARRGKPRDNLNYLGVDVEIVDVDITDNFHVQNEIKRVMPHEIYNLAAQSHVGQSFHNPALTCQVNYGGYLNVLLAARFIVPDCKIYQAGTSEMFGYCASTIANENTPFAPMSPYAISKVAAYWAGVNARFEASQFVCNGILFNHESPIRGEDFVTRKVSKYVAAWHKNHSIAPLEMGNLDASRDWGFAGDYVKVMHLMLRQSTPDDFVIATGVSKTIRNLLKDAFAEIDQELVFDGVGSEEVGYINGKRTVVVSEKYMRPNDLQYLCGTPKKAMQLLGWKPNITIDRLIKEMVREDIARA